MHNLDHNTNRRLRDFNIGSRTALLDAITQYAAEFSFSWAEDLMDEEAATFVAAALLDRETPLTRDEVRRLAETLVEYETLADPYTARPRVALPSPSGDLLERLILLRVKIQQIGSRRQPSIESLADSLAGLPSCLAGILLLVVGGATNALLAELAERTGQPATLRGCTPVYFGHHLLVEVGGIRFMTAPTLAVALDALDEARDCFGADDLAEIDQHDWA